MKPQSIFCRFAPAAVLAVFLLTAMPASTVRGQTRGVTLADLETLVQLGIGDEVIVTKIGANGIAFAADEQTLASLQTAGASKAVLDAVRAQSANKSNRAVRWPRKFGLWEKGKTSPSSPEV